jgi:xanthosine utilization system XapX-like protein
LRRKYRTGLIVAFVAPLLVGSIFKYFLLVPMPAEGLVVALLDAIWYFEF